MASWIQLGLSAHLGLWPGDPLIALADDRAGAGDGDVAAITGVDKRRIVKAFEPAPADKNRRKIIRRLGAESNDGALRQVKLDIAAEMNGAGEPVSSGDQDASAAGLGAGGDRQRNRLGNDIGSGVVGQGAEVTDVEDALRKSRRANPRHLGHRRRDGAAHGLGLLATPLCGGGNSLAGLVDQTHTSSLSVSHASGIAEQARRNGVSPSDKLYQRPEQAGVQFCVKVLSTSARALAGRAFIGPACGPPPATRRVSF